jgi:type II secretory pathway component GspD/PulD (secretin)
MSYNGDLWGSVEANLKSILTTKLATLDAQLIDTTAATAAGGGATAARPAAETSGDSSLLTQVINQVGSNAAAAVGGGGGAGGSASAVRGAGGGATGSSASGGAGTAGAQISPSIYYSINKQAGIITVMANSKKHTSVKEYLDKVRTNMSAQVLIEAKVVEVQLDEQFASGIDWSGFSILQHIGFPATQFAKGNLATASSGNVFKGVDPGLVTLNLGRDPKQDVNQIGAVLKMIQGFGTSRTLQSPRLTVLNNQQAVLSFAKNQTYYTVTGTLQTSNTTATTAGAATNTIPITVTSTLHTIPIGVILSMQPSIDVDSQEVTLHVRPTLSVKAGDGLPDPAVTLLASSITSGLAPDQQAIILNTLSDNKVPIIQVREMDTVLKMKSGGVMVIGGLIQHTDTNIEQGMPYTSRIPFFGNLFRSNQTLSNVTETIILIQATILPTNGYYDKHDKKLYEDFTNDPRPLVF